MIAHIIHDSAGTIKSVVFQGAEVDGELKIEVEGEGELVTEVEIDEVFQESAGGTSDSGSSGQDLFLIASDLRNKFRLDVQRRKLERLK